MINAINFFVCSAAFKSPLDGGREKRVKGTGNMRTEISGSIRSRNGDVKRRASSHAAARQGAIRRGSRGPVGWGE